MSNFNAIAPGTDLLQHARDLVRIHDAVVGGTRVDRTPRDVVARSWSRVMRYGLDASASNARDPHGHQEVLRRRRESPLRLVVDELIQVITGVGDASRFLMVGTDADGVILWRAGSAVVRSQADRLGFDEGAQWTESLVGTNAIGTALAEAAPVQLFSAEHFEQKQHGWYCTAAPLHDPRTGVLLGIVDVSGPALTLHPAIGALVETAARLAESQLWRHHEARLERVRRCADHLVASAPGPLLVIDDDGWVAHRTGVSTRDRVAAPREGTMLAVPGLGLCLPERLVEGWLVRPRGRDHRILADLDLRGAPVLEVRCDQESWHTPVSQRHADILRLLHLAGPEGLSAHRLSCALYGDGDHVVTVRAEISRLRRQVGGVVATRPYRLSDEVVLTVTGP